MMWVYAFASWIVFSFVTSYTDWRIGIVAGLVTQVVVMVVSGSRKIDVLDGAMIAFFLVVGAYAFAEPDSPLEDWVNSLAAAWLAVVALVSILVGHPFTVDYSADEAGPEIAATPLFLHINQVISGVWAACFAGLALCHSLAAAVDAPWVATAATVLLLAAAISFTQRYPDQAVARAAPG